jgi:hypothetical protein
MPAGIASSVTVSWWASSAMSGQFVGETESLAAGGQDLHGWGLRQYGLHQIRRSVDDVLAVVENQ